MNVIPFFGKFGQSFNDERIKSSFSLSDAVMIEIYI